MSRSLSFLLIPFLFFSAHSLTEYASEFSLGSPDYDWFFQPHTQLQKKFSLDSSFDIGLAITDLSSPQGKTDDAEGWLPAIVPGTVMGSLLHYGYLKNVTDPYYEFNLLYFPDMNLTGREYYTHWWRTNFTLSPPTTTTTRTWLHLRGINYAAEVYLNQHLLSTTDIHTVEGQFQRHMFDITPYLSPSGTPNLLAILVYPVYAPGYPNHGGQGGDHVIASNAATSQYVAGWDWVEGTPDRNTGIWDKISIIQTSGPILIQDPWIRTTGIGPTTIDVQLTLYNGDDTSVSGTVSYSVTNFSLTQSEAFILPPHTATVIVFQSASVSNPQLWWPHGYGPQSLYNMTFSVATSPEPCTGDDCSVPLDDNIDVLTTRFGIRDLFFQLGGLWNNGYKVYVNSEPIFIRGGNWITTDQLQRFATNATVYRWHVEMHRNMGMNMIRVWGGGIAERPEFYDACDEAGILVMQDFWMTGDSNGRWGGSYDYPNDHDLYLRCVKDTVFMLRNHPSLAIWDAGNELSPPGSNPPPDIADQMTEWLQNNPPTSSTIDGTRLFALSTMSEEGPPYSLALADGPYGAHPLRDWFHTDIGFNQSFNPEVGGGMLPVIESFHRFFSQQAIDNFPTKLGPCEDLQELNEVWVYHKYEGFCDSAGIDTVWLYGQPKTGADFVNQAQIAAYAQYRAVFEGYTSHMWDVYTGVLLWKSQGPWTDLRGHTYDWYGDQNGAFYGIKKALEPVHVQLNLEGKYYWRLCIVNTKFEIIPSANIIVSFYDIKGNFVESSNYSASYVAGNSRTLLDFLFWPTAVPETEVVFLRLQLYVSGNVVSENVYWLISPFREERQLEYVGMQNLKQNLVTLQGSLTVSDDGQSYNVQVKLVAPSFAFFVRLSLIQRTGTLGEDLRILPSFYEDNYFSLFPGETKLVNITCRKVLATSGAPRVQVTGWNVKTLILS